MTKRIHLQRACARLCAALLVLTSAFAASHSTGAKVLRGATQDTRVDIRLRSLTTRATGLLTIEASEGGGRARLTAMNLPDPQTVAAGANTYVVCAVSGRRILRLRQVPLHEIGHGGPRLARP